MPERPRWGVRQGCLLQDLPAGPSGPANALTLGVMSHAEDAEHFLEQTDSLWMLFSLLSLQEERMTLKIATRARRL